MTVDSSSQGAKLAAQIHREELRLAIALNGGVSLAVWMGGCVVELDRARRAGPDQDAPRVYDALCKVLGRRFVVDILTGTSAGGINGTLLAAAMAKGRRLHPRFIRERWLELGDLAKLLYGSEKDAPTALMDGEMFHRELLRTFKGILGTDENAPGYLDSAIPENVDPRIVTPALDVTMTDVLGVERRFRDSWGGELVAREHRPRFKFRERGHFTEKALAAAARTSASFPVAFDPWRVEGDAKVLAGLSTATYGIDGGLLDNAPIREALELIPTRPATSNVRRYFCYVNADPTIAQETTIGAPPTLAQVGGYAFNLPRTAPLVDHLYAVRGAVERSKRSRKVQDDLLGTELRKLEAVAAALFETYARRRTLQSLEELLPEPSDATAMAELLEETEGDLPWIPREWRPGREPKWEWGLRPAQRILHLLLDLLRPAAGSPKAGESTRKSLLETRIEIDGQVELLEETHATLTAKAAADDPSLFEPEGVAERVNRAAAIATESASQARASVLAAAEAMRRCMERNEDLFSPSTTQALFGRRCRGDRWERHFLRRVLAVEVVRRAFAAEADVESGEELGFVQLTPDSPSPIFSAHPLQLPGPTSAGRKLTGIGLGHFAGFYRRSWRVNDYMWGRLDAAARICDLLLDSPSGEVGDGAWEAPEKRAQTRATELAKALLDSAGADGSWHLEEVWKDQQPSRKIDATLEGWLQETIAGELLAAEGEEAGALPVTRALFQRAAQLEILREELPELVAESEKDEALGAGAKALPLGGQCPEQGVADEILAIRKLYGRGSSLPQELTAPAEEVSNLGLQTITHAVFVGLAALRATGAPLVRSLGLVRPPVLAIAGTVARNPLYRATVAAGFWTAALFLTSCFVSAEDIHPTFAGVWTPATLAGVAALLGVAGLVAVPWIRAKRHVHTPRNYLYAGLLLLSGGGYAAIAAWLWGELSLEQLVATPGAELPKEPVLWIVLFALGAVSAVRLPLPGWLPLGEYLEKAGRNETALCIVMLLSFALLAAFCGQTVVGALDGEWWEKSAAAVALVGAPVCAAFAVTLWRRN